LWISTCACGGLVVDRRDWCAGNDLVLHTKARWRPCRGAALSWLPCRDGRHIPPGTADSHCLEHLTSNDCSHYLYTAYWYYCSQPDRTWRVGVGGALCAWADGHVCLCHLVNVRPDHACPWLCNPPSQLPGANPGSSGAGGGCGSEERRTGLRRPRPRPLHTPPCGANRGQVLSPFGAGGAGGDFRSAPPRPFAPDWREAK
jgi:hypothetical protein